MPVFIAKTFIQYGLDWIRYFAGMTDKVLGKNISSALTGNGEIFIVTPLLSLSAWWV